MNAHGFMHSILQHIPPKQFRMVRHYGAYSRRKICTVKIFVKQLTIMQKILPDFTRNVGFCCTDCGGVMDIVCYLGKPPPRDMSKITNWID